MGKVLAFLFLHQVSSFTGNVVKSLFKIYSLKKNKKITWQIKFLNAADLCISDPALGSYSSLLQAKFLCRAVVRAFPHPCAAPVPWCKLAGCSAAGGGSLRAAEEWGKRDQWGSPFSAKEQVFTPIFVKLQPVKTASLVFQIKRLCPLCRQLIFISNTIPISMA